MDRGKNYLLYIGLLSGFLLQSIEAMSAEAQETNHEPMNARVETTSTQLPLLFIENRGQLDPQAAYSLQGKNSHFYFSAGGVTLALNGPIEPSFRPFNKKQYHRTSIATSKNQNRWVLKLDFVDSNPLVKPIGEFPQATRFNYFKGRAGHWQTGLKTYTQIRYPGLWPGIDLVYRSSANQLKYYFLIKPGADPNQIQLAYRGANRISLSENGQLIIKTPLGDLQDNRPLAYQELNGKRMEVTSAYALRPADNGTWGYGFELGNYDASLPIYLDPAVLVYAGYIGGSDLDGGQGIAVDEVGNAYVTGWTRSSEASFPVKAGLDTHLNGKSDAFIAKLNASGTALVYASYIGGDGAEKSNAIALDLEGNIYITGVTHSTETSFPVKGGPDLTHNGRTDAFVAKLNASGTELVYAGYIGGDDSDRGNGIAVDSAGNAYVTGNTYSTETSFPVKAGLDRSHQGESDAFVVKVNSTGKALDYASYIGGDSIDEGNDISVDARGNAYITGTTGSSEKSFPVTKGPDLTHDFGTDAFVAKLDSTGKTLEYAGYIGGSSVDRGYGIAVDEEGNAYVTGSTSSQHNFPIKGGPDQRFNGLVDAFIAKVNVTGTELDYAGYIGGKDADIGFDIALDNIGNAYITGFTMSTKASFRSAQGPCSIHKGDRDAFVAKVYASNQAVAYVCFIGGSNVDEGYGIAVDADGNAFITGMTKSTQKSFPVMLGPDMTFNGKSDAFVAKFSEFIPTDKR